MRPSLETYFRTSEHGSENNKVIFIFGGWKARPGVYKPLLRDLANRGFKCILYLPHTRLVAVGTPYSEIVAASGRAVEDVQQRIKQEKHRGVTVFGCFGISLGTIFATESAKTFPEIDTLVLLAPFGDFAEHVTLWPGHKYFSKVLASQPTSQADSGTVLNRVGLHKNLAKLKGKRIFIGYASNDNVTHTKVAEKFIAALKESQIHVETTKVKGGHLLGILQLLLVRKSYMHLLTNHQH